MLTSYAQNFEDVILWRALKHIENGFYIDIGAQDPRIDSVSLLFYEHGWRGVHVEPTAQYADKLRAARPDEEVVQAVISERAGTIRFFEIETTGLSTGDEAIAERHRSDGWSVVATDPPTLRLSELFGRYGDRDVHWLKIDVEGMEKEVISSWGASEVRPWIVVVESTEPGSPRLSHGVWERSLKRLGYKFVYFDGLNRFYVSSAKPELVSAFGPGPNIFDDFALSGSASAPFVRMLQGELSGRDEQIVHLTQALETSAEKFERREVALLGLRDQVGNLEGRLAAAQEIAARHAAEAQSELRERSNEIARLTQVLEAADENAERREVALRDQAVHLEGRLAAAQEIAARHAAEAQSELRERSDEIARLTQALEAADEDAERREVALGGLRDQAAHLERRLAAAHEIAARQVAGAQSELRERSDEIVRLTQVLEAAGQDARRHEVALGEFCDQVWHLEQRLASEHERAVGHAAELTAFHRSTSWRVTAPLRTFKRLSGWFGRGVSAWLLLKPGSRPRRVAGSALCAARAYLVAYPRAKRLALRAVGLLPPLQARLSRFARSQEPVDGASGPPGMAWYLEAEASTLAEWARVLSVQPTDRPASQ